MFYAHFVLSKKGPLARIWLAAHWDKKLTKAHVFETNIDSSVEAIMQPKVKLALRTSGHLLLGVVRIYSRKAKYLLADCNEAFVKIKMAFRPGVVDLPEENREAAITAITLQENFHDFDTTLADLNDLDVQAQFSVNQSRPEEITMREDLASITFVGDDGFGIMDGFGGELDEDEIFLIIFGDQVCDINNKTISQTLEQILNFEHISKVPLLNSQANDSCQNNLDMENYCVNVHKTDYLDTLRKPVNSPKPRIVKLDSGIGMDSDSGHSDSDEGCACGSDSDFEDNCDDKIPCDAKIPCDDGKSISTSTSSVHQVSGDVGFDDREILRDATNLEDSLYKQPDISNHQPVEEKEKTLNENVADKPMDVDLEAPVHDDEFGGPVDGGFMDADDDDDDDDDGGFGGGVDQEFFGDDLGGLFEDAPMADVSMPPQVEAQGPTPEKIQEPVGAPHSPQAVEPAAPQVSIVAAGPGEQTTLINNEEEAFALPPLDATVVPGVEKKGKRKRKLIVDEQKGIPSETMKLQLSDTSDVVTTLDLAPPTKKLMHWKETGGVEKLFSLPGRAIASKSASKLFGRNLVTRQVKEEEEQDDERLVLDAPEITREEDTTKHNKSRTRQQEEISTIIEEPSTLEVSTRSSRHSEMNSTLKPASPQPEAEKSVAQEQSNAQDLFVNTFTEGVVDMPADPTAINPNLDPYDADPPSIAPFSVPPPSVPPPSVPPPSVPPCEAPTFNVDGDAETEAMPENEEQEEKRWTKRTQQMQHSLDVAFRYKNPLSFKEMSRNLNRKQVASRFYTMLVLKKYQTIEVDQPEEFGDIYIRKGPQFGVVC